MLKSYMSMLLKSMYQHSSLICSGMWYWCCRIWIEISCITRSQIYQCLVAWCRFCSQCNYFLRRNKRLGQAAIAYYIDGKSIEDARTKIEEGKKKTNSKK